MTNDKNENAFNTLVGGYIKLHRMAMKMTQTDLSKRCGISRTTLAQIEIGRQGITAWQLKKISSALRVTIGRLIPTGWIE